MQTETFTLPASWASFLINGDASGLADDEVAEIDAMYDETVKQGYLRFEVMSCDGEAYFSKYIDFLPRGPMREVLAYQVRTA
jgi:hypothetical protein